MKIGYYKQMIAPLLQFLGSTGGAVRSKDAYQGVAELFGLTEEDKRRLLSSGIQFR